MRLILRLLDDRDSQYKDSEIVDEDKSFMDTFGPILIGLSVLVGCIICCTAFILFVKFVIMRDKTKVPSLKVTNTSLFLITKRI